LIVIAVEMQYSMKQRTVAKLVVIVLLITVSII